jgi:predicted RNA binding protein YcfA (HicA-like mRNA interferase family)
MSQWSATKAKQVLKALKSIGWKIKPSGLFPLK